MNTTKRNRRIRMIFAVFGAATLVLLATYWILLTQQSRIINLVLSLPQINTPYRIEGPKMIKCVNNQQPLCYADGIGSFAAKEPGNICIFWVEVDRKSSDTLSIRIYDEKNLSVFSYDENRDSSSTHKRECRYIPVKETLAPGKYRTEFIVAGRPLIPALAWEVK